YLTRIFWINRIRTGFFRLNSGAHRNTIIRNKELDVESWQNPLIRKIRVESAFFLEAAHHALPELRRRYVPVELRRLRPGSGDEAGPKGLVLIDGPHLFRDVRYIRRVNEQGG